MSCELKERLTGGDANFSPPFLRTQHSALITQHWLQMAERVGFEPTVPLLGRMLSKHVDSTTLAPLRTDFREAAS